MWVILEKKTVVKVFKNAPKSFLIRYEAWKRIVELEGPKGLRVIKGFHDEALKGEWKGFRSSRLGIQWRVIYRVDKGQLEVYVVEITPHDYRR
ncbi:MAG: type II toxin-antitoxin system mRNA interferase toxin, RelE/StbE family [Bdellovibrionales bacterium]|nr:type II toxin-antitoxin system mRNA interferase toxin, RelE/StbE family [Bdellovibrionales bacterium]